MKILITGFAPFGGEAALHDKIKPSLPLATIADGLLACLKAL